MPIQDPHAIVKRQEGGQVAYKAVPFDEPQPAAFQRKPPVLQQHDRKDFPSNSQYQKAVTAAQKQYEAENTAYQAEKADYNKAMEGWLGRKAAWENKEEGKVNASGAGQQRLTDYLKTPEGRKQLEFNNQMLTYPFLPAALVATQIGKGMRGPISKVGYGLLEAGAGEGLGYLERQNQPKKYEDPAGYYQNEAYQNFLQSTGLGAGVGSIRAALLKPNQGPGFLERLLTRAPAKPPTPPQEPPPAPPPVEPYKGTTRDVARLVAHDLGVGGDIGSDEPKSAIVQRALDAIRNGTSTPEQIATVTKKAHGTSPEEFLGERVLKSNRRITGLAGLLGLGAAAAAAGTPNEAEAGPMREESLPHYRARKIVEGVPEALNAASYAVPGVGAMRTAADIGSAAGEVAKALPTRTPGMPEPSVTDPAYNPRSKAWSDAMQARRSAVPPPHQEPHLLPVPKLRSQEIGAEAASAVPPDEGYASGGSAREPAPQTPPVNPEQHSFIPEHLPEHERGFLNNPAEAHERSKWLIPYLRAGAEAQRRGEDFFGGSPEYENQLAALKYFYHGPRQAPVAEEAPTAKEGFKHGGSINKKSNAHLKQLNSIHDTFKHKLADKERMIASLEKAVARKPNAKLSKRIAKEKSEAQRIHEHLQKIMTYA